MARGGGGQRGPDRTRQLRAAAASRWWSRCRPSRLFFGVGLAVVLLLCLAMGLWQQSLLTAGGDASGKQPRRVGPDPLYRPAARRQHRPSPGGVLRFQPSDLLRRFEERGELMRRRSEEQQKLHLDGVRPTSLALVTASLNKDPQSLMLLTLVKGLKELGYIFTVFALEKGEAQYLWEHVGCQVFILSSDSSGSIDWSNYEGIILISLEAEKVISRFMHEPFFSIPIIWLIQEDTLGKRLSSYKDLGLQHLVATWRNAFTRADVVVFPDFSLPMLYTSLDTGNFFVIPQSPVDVWAAKTYMLSHSRYQLRKDSGFSDNELVVVVIGSYFSYDDLPWDYAAAMNAIAKKLNRISDLAGRIKFVLLCGNSTEELNSDIQELASHMGFSDGSIRHFGMDGDVNGVILMADIVLYGSFQEEQSFPPLLVRAMSFEIPIIAPDFAIIKKYVINHDDGLIFIPSQPDTLVEAFSVAIADSRLTEQAHAIASRGKTHAMNMFAFDCIADYAKLLEHVLHFPSEVVLPGSISLIRQNTWLWDLLEKENVQHESSTNNDIRKRRSIVDTLEGEYTNATQRETTTLGDTNSFIPDIPTLLDWNDLSEIEIAEDIARREMEEQEERMERNSGTWEDIYRNSRKIEKQKFEASERDEGELERTGHSLCIYEIYAGEGSWSFLHHGSLYRGINLSNGARRSRSDDVDAVGRLPILNDTYYRDLLCEFGAMFSVAYQVDSIHKIPWIGFQSWRAAGRKVFATLSTFSRGGCTLVLFFLSKIEKTDVFPRLARQGGRMGVCFWLLDNIHTKNQKFGYECHMAKVSLSNEAEMILERSIQAQTKGDLLFYWAPMDLDQKEKEGNKLTKFWSRCDISNAGRCRIVFEDTFRKMYGLPPDMAALPPMPTDGGKWSSLHSWVMPTPSFLEFVMFSRMFVDSLHSLNQNTSSYTPCVLGSSQLEKRQCYCRVLEVLVNVWAYHSARRMFYLNPSTGELEEQHPVEQRKGLMWVQYFNATLLKSMDEDLAEEADDDTHPTDKWLWPLTGEVHWKGILDREREERYRRKMDRKRKNKEKLLERQRVGYKQKPISTNKDG